MSLSERPYGSYLPYRPYLYACPNCGATAAHRFYPGQPVKAEYGEVEVIGPRCPHCETISIMALVIDGGIPATARRGG